MVIEGILTTENADGSLHVAPIGPHVDVELSTWTLKPFQTSSTFSNLRRTNRCVFHVTDDALLMAQSVLGLFNREDATPAAVFESEIGWLLSDACRVFALRIHTWDVSHARAEANCSLLWKREQRPFWGWNRAANSILEMSILTSRRHLLEPTHIATEMERHRIIIEKTAGPREKEAWELLKAHLSQ